MPIQAISDDDHYGYSIQPLYADWQLLQMPQVFHHICADGVFFVMARYDRDVALYQIDLANSNIVARREFTFAGEHWQGKGGPNIAMDVQALAASSDGKRLAIATTEGVHIIDLQANKDLGQLVFDPTESGGKQDIYMQVVFVSFSRDGRQVAGVNSSSWLYIWNLPR